MLPGDNSTTFWAGRQFAARLNVSRFELLHTILNVGSVFQLPQTGGDRIVPVKPGRNQKTQLKDVEFSVFLPTCPTVDDPEVIEQSITGIAGVYQAYTFLVSVNGQQWEYPVVFNQNVQKQRSAIWYAMFPEVVNEFDVFVRRDAVTFNNVWDNVPVTLAATFEFYCFAQ